MKKITDRFQNTLSSFIEIITVMIGVYGLIGGLVHSLRFPKSAISGVYILVGLAAFIYIGYMKERNYVLEYKKLYYLVLVIGFLVYFPHLVFMKDALKEVILENYFLEFVIIFEKSKSTDFFFPSLFIVLSCLPLTVFMVKLVFYKHKVMMKSFVLMIVFFFPIFIRHRMYSLSSYCFLFFMIYVYIFCYALKNQNPITLKLVLLPIFAILLFLSSLLLEPSSIFDEQTSTVLTHITEWMNGNKIDEIFRDGNISGTSSSVSGKLPTSSISVNDSLALTVESTKPFTSYIRGYSLAHYDKNEWKKVNAEFNGKKDSVQMIVDKFRKLGLNYDVSDVKIKSEKKTNYQFTPYFPRFSQPLIEDSFYEPFEGSFIVYTNQPLISQKIPCTSKLYSETDYDLYVAQEYLDVPEYLKDKLIRFIRENQKINLFEEESQELPNSLKIKELSRMLTNAAKYDLKTGDLPEDKDFVEYFLFENKKGSCSHFATTLTLLLRCVDIPARYTRGYVISRADFEENVAEVLNNRSHAWVEVYFKGYGWVPVEATPHDESEDTLVGFAALLDSFLKKDNETPSTTPDTPDEPDIPQNNQDKDIPAMLPDEPTSGYENLIEYIPIFMNCMIGIVIVMIYRLSTKNILKYKLSRLSSNEKVLFYYRRMKKMKKFGGVIDFQFIDIAKKAKFSQHTIDETELKEVSDLYDQYIQDIYRKLPRYKKFIFKYIFGYV